MSDHSNGPGGCFERIAALESLNVQLRRAIEAVVFLHILDTDIDRSCPSCGVLETAPCGHSPTCPIGAALALTLEGAGEHRNLFQSGDFTLHSGEKSRWKIDCDALTDADIATLALMIVQCVPEFGAVAGIPHGGVRLANALEKYRVDGVRARLIVDDVLTTGASMEMARILPEDFGAVVFARGPCPDWIMPLFTMADRPKRLAQLERVWEAAKAALPIFQTVTRQAVPLEDTGTGKWAIERVYEALADAVREVKP